MPEFVYSAVVPTGKTRIGRLKAADEDEVQRVLAAGGDILLEIKSRREQAHGIARGAVPARDLIEFTEQLVMLFDSGVPLATGLADLAEAMTLPTLRQIVRHVHEMVCQGAPLSAALEVYPKVFSPTYIAVVISGQETGEVGKCLDRLARTMEWQLETKASIKGALIYPAFLLFATTGLIVLLVTYLIPRLADVFLKAGVQLPAVTRVALALSDFVRLRWPWLVGAIVAILAGVVLLKATVRGRMRLDRFLLKAPFFGRLLTMGAGGNFANLMGMLIGAGVSIVRALEITCEAMPNRAVKAAIKGVHANVLAGEPISRSLGDTRIFPPLVLRMVAIGEQSGQMTQALQKAATFYDREVPRQVKKFMAIVQPTLTIFLGAAVGFAVFAAFMPMMKLLGALKGG